MPVFTLIFSPLPFLFLGVAFVACAFRIYQLRAKLSLIAIKSKFCDLRGTLTWLYFWTFRFLTHFKMCKPYTPHILKTILCAKIYAWHSRFFTESIFALCTKCGDLSRALRLGDFFVNIWLRNALPRLIRFFLHLNRLAAPRFVFIFGIVATSFLRFYDACAFGLFLRIASLNFAWWMLVFYLRSFSLQSHKNNLKIPAL